MEGQDKVSSLLPPRAVPTISAARENGVASGDPRASAPNPHPETPSLAPTTPPALALGATPAATPDLSASGAFPNGRNHLVASEKDARGEESGQPKPHQDAPQPKPVAASPAAAPATLPAAEAVANAERRIAALESDKKALAAEVSRLERDREAPTQTNSIRSPTLAGPVQEPNSGPGSQAAVDAEKRIAALESDKEALTAEVRRLERDRESSEKASVAPAAATAIPAAESAPGSGALASLPEGMPARVLIRYPRGNADAQRQAESLADALKKQGVEVADLRESDGAVRTGVSFFYARDAAAAQRIGGLIGIAPTRRPQMRDGLMARPGAIELSFSGDSHLSRHRPRPERRVSNE